MSDRIIISLATIPMVSGIFLVALLDRPSASASRERARPIPSIEQQVAKRGAGDGFVGVVSAGNNAELAAEFEGRVTHVWAKAGDSLQAGAPILEIDRTDIDTTLDLAGAELGQRKSDVQRAEARLEAARLRVKRLDAAGSWVSTQELDGARTELRVAEADLGAARAAVNMGRARLSQQRVRAQKHRIVAPFAGRLASVDVDPGDSVAAGQLVVRLISDERVIRFALPRAAFSERALGTVQVRLKGQERLLPARVTSVRPEVDSAAQLVFASAALPDEAVDAPGWMPGSVVDVFPLAEREQLELTR